MRRRVIHFNMELKQVKEQILKAFKEGQETPDACDGIIKVWIAGELGEIK